MPWLKVIVKDSGLERGQQTRVLPPRPVPSLSPQQGRLGWAKDSDGRQSQPSHCKAPLQTPGLAMKAAPGARTGSGPQMVTNIIQIHLEFSPWTKVLVWVGEIQSQAGASLQGGCSCSLGRDQEWEQEPQLSSSPEWRRGSPLLLAFYFKATSCTVSKLTLSPGSQTLGAWRYSGSCQCCGILVKQTTWSTETGLLLAFCV